MAAFETFQMGSLVVPRIWVGLWQLSSPAWGTASASRIKKEMMRYFEQGYTTFADHYGSAELLFGQFRESSAEPEKIIGATKWCIFRPLEVNDQTVAAGVGDRMKRMRTKAVDILQIHWGKYSDKAYLDLFGRLHDFMKEGRITALGLCNFDSKHTDEICNALGPGVIASNQVQFSLIDTRPLEKMIPVCEKHNVKLVTYGTLCGGFLSDKWLGQPLPDAYAEDVTPSQRKYSDVIMSAWGGWDLFQSLLKALRAVGDRHGGVSISNVATRWVLEQSCVGAVIIGARMGVAEHIEDNKIVFTFKLTAEDKNMIEEVLQKSKRKDLINRLGDCGGEYR